MALKFPLDFVEHLSISKAPVPQGHGLIMGDVSEPWLFSPVHFVGVKTSITFFPHPCGELILLCEQKRRRCITHHLHIGAHKIRVAGVRLRDM